MNRIRKPLIAGNWKLHHGGQTGIDLAVQVARAAAHVPAVDVVIAPPFTALSLVSRECQEVARQLRCPEIGLAGQNLYPEPKGAFTGEVSAPMLHDVGARWVILGHSERRQYFGEQDELVAAKARAALSAGLSPIVCVGETLEQREQGRTLEVVLGMLGAVIPSIAGSPSAVIAYEPVWAIGTGKVATAEDAQEVHAAIRARLAQSSAELAQGVRLLYGGSVKAENAESLLTQPDIDGALVGGASLDIQQFGPIMRAAQQLAD